MRILIISDIHANLVALEAVLLAAGVYDWVWCLGDLVGYGPHPNECITRIVELGALCLPGNHDWAVLGKLDISEFNADAQKAVRWTRHVLTEANRSYLDALPERRAPELERFTLVHASPRQPIWEYVSSPAVAHANFPYFDTQVCLLGHTHVPAIFRQQENGLVTGTRPIAGEPLDLGLEKMILNPGSVGQPRDGDPRASYGILEPDAGRLTLNRLVYDVASTQAAMRAAKLPERLVTRLNYGI